jgi:hypothetical protein
MPLKESPLDCDAWDWCVRKDRFAIRVPAFLFQPHEKKNSYAAFPTITLEPILELQQWLQNLYDEDDQISDSVSADSENIRRLDGSAQRRSVLDQLQTGT